MIKELVTGQDLIVICKSKSRFGSRLNLNSETNHFGEKRGMAPYHHREHVSLLSGAIPADTKLPTAEEKTPGGTVAMPSSHCMSVALF